MNKKKLTSLIIVFCVSIIAIIGLVLVKNFNPEEESFFICCTDFG